MPNKKITELDELINIDVADILPVVDISELDESLRNKKVTVANLTALVGSPVTTKGDIITYTTQPIRLPVGTDGQLLVANSSEASGLQWQTFALGEPYVSINSVAGAVPADLSPESIIIGPDTVADINSPFTIGIGFAVDTNSCERTILIGRNIDVFAANDAIAIGTDITSLSVESVLLGARTESSSNSGVAVGADASATGFQAIAIGKNSNADDADCISIGENSQTINGSGSIALGSDASVDGLRGIAIGDNTIANSVGGISVGNLASVLGDNAVVLGTQAIVEASSTQSIAIGRRATAGSGITPAVDSIAIGTDATVDGAGVNGIALGTNAQSQADNAVQIGVGSNPDASTLNFLTNRLANTEGLYTGHTAVNYTPADPDNVDSHFAAIDTVLATAGGNPYIAIGFSTGNFPTAGGNSIAIGDNVSCSSVGGLAIGRNATGDFSSPSVIAIGDGANGSADRGIAIGNDASCTVTDSIALGHDATAASSDSIALGHNTNTGTGNDGAIAIGDFASVTSNIAEAGIAIGRVAVSAADGAIQLGAGTNNTPNTLQFQGNIIANASGLVYWSPQEERVPNRETIVADKTLLETDAVRHHFFLNTTNGGNPWIVTLPISPASGTTFLIKNNKNSTTDLEIDENGTIITLTPTDIYYAYYDGVVWVEI